MYAFQGVEEVHTPYEFAIELVSLSASEDITSLVGKAGCLTIADKSGASRPVHGIIRQMEQLHTANRFTHYRCWLVPRLYFLDKIIDHRIFQKKKVDEIIQQILTEQGFAGGTFSFKLSKTYKPREYCVQYGETDLHFISRLCEEEGIYYYFEHSQSSHTLCFCDRENGPDIPGNATLRYYRGSGNVADTAVVSEISLRQQVNSNMASYREWNFIKPRLDQEVMKDESAPEKAPVPPGMQLEQYRFPHLYTEPSGGEGTPGTQYAEVQLARQITYGKWVEGEADVSRLVPSFVFTLDQHPRGDLNARWWVTRTEHEGEQPQVLEHEATSDRGLHYKARFKAIPAMTRFVAELAHPKRRVVGDQTAIVTGPEGEEIYPDKYGRVKVQFFWDREGQWDDNTTCWIRVSQGWAGSTYGTMAIPRIGHEVVVRFLEGDPDRPLITGRVYHELNMPPYELPDHKTRTVFKSMTTPGEEGKERGFNELRIEDKEKEEEIYIHAEKDVNVYVKNDWKEHILHDKHETIDASRYTHIKGEEHLIIEKPRKVELKKQDHLIVHEDSHSEYKTKWLAKAGEEIHFKAGDKVVIEAGSDLTIKGGGSFIRLTPAGVVILGAKVKINEGGSPGSGSGAAPEEAEEAIKTDKGTNPMPSGFKKVESKQKQRG